MPDIEPLSMTPIGFVRTPFPDRVSAPRQPHVSEGAEGTIELLPGRDFEHALSDLEGWDYLWVIFWFHLNTTWRPKVLPPRSAKKRRGEFSTRSPHRPNPIGLSVVKLEHVEGLVLRVRDVDMIDGTPVLDLKPYIPYCDAHPQARTGWLESLATEKGAAPPDPEPGFTVTWSDLARTQASWLRDAHHVDLFAPVERTLALGPQPHPYRRIKVEEGTLRLAVKDWRVRFRVEGRVVVVESVRTGYRPEQLATAREPAVAVHRAYVAQFAFA